VAFVVGANVPMETVLAPRCSLLPRRRRGPPMRLRPLVLLIDDDPNTRAAIARLVRQEGVVVAEAPDGQDGFQRASETVPDFIITTSRCRS